jgi:hypothetical protein
VNAARAACLGRGLLALSLGACSKPKADVLTIVEGTSTSRFTVKSAFADYVELPGARNELRITLAGYPASCDRWTPPGEDERLVTVVVVTPPDAKPAVATYPWLGLPPDGEPVREPYALPKALHGKTSRLFDPGGGISLTGVALEQHGSIRGTLAFEFPGAADRPATRIEGSFTAPLCRVLPVTR